MGKMSELIIDSATVGSEANSSNKLFYQENSDKMVYSSGAKKTMRSKFLLENVDYKKNELSSIDVVRKVEKAKFIPDFFVKSAKLAERRSEQKIRMI